MGAITRHSSAAAFLVAAILPIARLGVRVGGLNVDVFDGYGAVGAWLQDFVNAALRCSNGNGLRLVRITWRAAAIGCKSLDPVNGKWIGRGLEGELVSEPLNAVASFIGRKFAIRGARSGEGVGVGWKRGDSIRDEHCRGVFGFVGRRARSLGIAVATTVGKVRGATFVSGHHDLICGTIVGTIIRA